MVCHQQNIEQFHKKKNKAFCETLNVEAAQLAGLKYQAVPSWDSVGHMTLIAAIEDEFEIQMDTDDIIDMSSFEKAQEILAKYDIQF